MREWKVSKVNSAFVWIDQKWTSSHGEAYSMELLEISPSMYKHYSHKTTHVLFKYPQKHALKLF